jgi:hypothetical protein
LQVSIDRYGCLVLVPPKYEPEDLFRNRAKVNRVMTTETWTGPLPWRLAVRTLEPNVVVRLLIGDDPQQTPIAEAPERQRISGSPWIIVPGASLLQEKAAAAALALDLQCRSWLDINKMLVFDMTSIRTDPLLRCKSP